MTEQLIDITAVESVKEPKDFRSATDIESFYRFINDNDLRREARIVLQIVVDGLKQLNAPAKRKRRSTH